LLVLAASTYRRDGAVGRLFDADHRDLDAEHDRREREAEVVLDHDGEPGRLLLLVAGVDDGLCGHCLEFLSARRTHAATTTCHAAADRPSAHSVRIAPLWVSGGWAQSL
jgi:hypothetical protein